MPESTYIQLQPPSLVLANARGEPVDVGAFHTLEVEFCVHEAGSGEGCDIRLQHAAVPADEAFNDLAPESGTTTISLLAADENYWRSYHSFLRYVRWIANSSLDGGPRSAIHVIAKRRYR